MKAQHVQCGCMLVLEMDHRGVVGMFFSSGLGTVGPGLEAGNLILLNL